MPIFFSFSNAKSIIDPSGGNVVLHHAAEV